MALVVKDRVKETTATTGTGTLTLAGALTGFQSFSSALSDGDTTYYAIFESNTGEWEVGLGTFTASGTTLARTTVLASSNSGSAVNLTAGSAEVFITQPATKAAYFDASGDLVLNQDPTSNLQAATKQYVDTIAAAGLHYHSPVRVQTTANLNATYDNGSSGVGATLTNSGTQAAISIDNVTLSSADRVLVSEQTNAAHNGVYTVTTVGSGSTNWVLTRATDADSYGPSDPDALGEGDAFFIKEGDTNAGHLDVMTTSGTITFGTTDIVFSEVAETTVYSAGNGLTLTGTTFAAGAGTGVTVNANDIAIGQSVGTGDTVTFATVNANLTGNVTGNLTGNVTGNADTATAWATGRSLTLSGDVTGTATGIDGSGNIAVTTTIAADSVALGTDTTGNYVSTGAVSGNGLSGSASAEGATFTVTSNATNANTASTIVFRDGAGDFSAGTITATLNGNATTATTATTANGVAANSVALGTDTTGNYVAGATQGTGVTVSGTPGEGWSPTISIGQDVATTANVTFNNVTVDGSVVFEGATADDYETTLSVTDPTADRTVTIPDASGTVVLQDSNGDVLLANLDKYGWGSGTTYVTASLAGTPRIDTYVGSTNTFTVDGYGALVQNGYSYAFTNSGSTFYTNLEAVDPTADRTITFPNASGDVAIVGSTGIVIEADPTYVKSVAFENTAGTHATYVTATNPTFARTITFPDASGNVAVFSTAPTSAITDGTNGQVLTTDGSGGLSFADAGGGGGDMSWPSAWPDDPDTTTGGNIPIGELALANLIDGGNNNIAIGYNALPDKTTGDDTIAIGRLAGDNDTTDTDSIYIGATSAGTSASTNSIAIGYAAKVGGNYEVAIGYAAGAAQATNDNNVYIGYAAGNYNTSSKDNIVYIGYATGNDAYGDYGVAVGGAAMTDGNHIGSVAVGYDALGRSSTSSPYYNIGIGYQTGNDIYSGDYNVYMGYDTNPISNADSYAIGIGYLAKSTTYSVGIGYQAMGSTVDGSDNNVCIGYQAGYDLDGGDYCTFIGHSAGYAGGTGLSNTGVGASALQTLTSGTQNAGCGVNALREVTSGSNNAACGSSAGRKVTTGGNNTFVGRNAGYQQGGSTTNALTTGSNVTLLGYEAMSSSATATNEITLGDNNITSLRCNVQTISSLSDERDKTAIEDLPYGLDFINDMRPVQFTWNRRDGSLGATPDMGFIAQDLYDVELDHSSTSRTRLVKWDDPSKLEADYLRSYPILVKAVQQLSAKCDALEARIAELEGN